jgi:hypothetical protein
MPLTWKETSRFVTWALMRWNWLFLLQLAVATAVWQERASR